MKFATKLFLRIILVLASIAIGLVALSTTVLLLAYSFPTQFWKSVETYVLPSDMKVTWEKIEFDASRHSWQNWEVKLTFVSLDIVKNSPKFNLPLNDFTLVIGLNLFQNGPPIALNQLVIRSNDTIEFWDKKTERTAPETNLYQQLQSVIDPLKKVDWITNLGEVDISLKKIAYHSLTNEIVTMSTEFSKLVGSQKLEYTLAIDINSKSNAPDSVQLNGSLNVGAIGSDLPFIETIVTSKGSQTSLDTAIRVIYKSKIFSIIAPTKIEHRLGKTKIQSQSNINISITTDQANIKIATNVVGLPTPLVALKNVKTSIHVPLSQNSNWSNAPIDFKITAPLKLFFIDQNMRRPIENHCHCRIPELLLTELQGQVWITPLLNENSSNDVVADLALKIEGLKNKLFEVDIGGNLKVLKSKKTFSYLPTLNSEIKINSFAGLRQFLDAKNILIPAPLDILDGTITAIARGPVTFHGASESSSTAMIDVDLASKNQVAKLNTSVFLTASSDFKNIDVNVHTEIDQLTLQLPPLDPILGLPSTKRDPRILLEPPASKVKNSVKVQFNFSFETKKPGAIRLIYRLADPYIPISLAIKNSIKDSLQGSVHVESFRINYLRRQVLVEVFTIDMSQSDAEVYPIDGRLLMNQTEYKIMIHIGGTTDQPIVNFSSDPYLSRADIISVILYDRTNSQLVSGDAETVGSVQAAMADRAIGLLGLWAFASTPIRSFSYNPMTKVYTATVALGDGLTAGIGTSWEKSTSFEVRKRLSKRWILSATWDPSPDQGNVGRVVIQWEKRF